MPRNQEDRITIVTSILVFALAIFLYLPTVQYGFVNWDDSLYITQNPLIQQLTPARILKIFALHTYISANYHPITLLFSALQYSFFHQDPSGYHEVSTMLHALNGILVWIFIFCINRSRRVALLTTLVFVLHPLQVESVAWISEQKTLLSASFSLLTLITYIRFVQKKQARYYWLSFISYLLAVFSKPTAVALPLILHMTSRFLQNGSHRKGVIYLLPFLLAASAQATLAMLAHRAENAFAPLGGGNIVSHSVLPFWTLFVYIKKIYLPYDLLPLYPPLQKVSWLNPEYLLPAVGIILALILMIRARKRFRLFYFSSVFFVISLLPTLNIVPLSVPLADRYLYLPMLGPLLLTSIGLTRLYDRYRHSAISAPFFSATALIVAYTLFNISRVEMGHWKDSERLWTHVIRKAPFHALAHVKLADHLYVQGKLDQGIFFLKEGIKLGLKDPIFAKNLVAMYIAKGDLELARQSASSMLKRWPRDERFYIQLGMIESNSSAHLAENYFRKATALNPHNAFAWYEWGRFCLQNQKDVNRAYQYFLKSVGINPDVADFHIGIADCFARVGDHTKAIETLKYALSLDESSPTAWLNLEKLQEIQRQNEASGTVIQETSELTLKGTPKQ